MESLRAAGQAESRSSGDFSGVDRTRPAALLSECSGGGGGVVSASPRFRFSSVLPDPPASFTHKRERYLNAPPLIALLVSEEVAERLQGGSLPTQAA